jgi:hypothetical protein
MGPKKQAALLPKSPTLSEEQVGPRQGGSGGRRRASAAARRRRPAAAAARSAAPCTRPRCRPPLPPQWALANSLPGLLEVLGAPPGPAAKDAPKDGGRRPPATRAQAALWLAAYAAAGEGARDEAFKAGAAELCARLAVAAPAAGAPTQADPACARGDSAAVVAAALRVLAGFAAGPPQMREAVLASRPPALGSVAAALAGGHSSCVAAAAGGRGVQGAKRA